MNELTLKPISLNDGVAADFSYVPEEDELRFPRIKLAQGLSPEVLSGEARPGAFVMPDGTTQDEIVVRVLGIRRIRTLWSDDRRPLCASNDGVTGTGEPGGACDECPMSKWTEGRPPECTLMYQYLVQYDGGLATYTASVRSASNFIKILNTNVLVYGPNGFTATIKSSLVTKGKKQYYVPVAVRVVADRGVLTAGEDVKF